MGQLHLLAVLVPDHSKPHIRLVEHVKDGLRAPGKLAHLGQDLLLPGRQDVGLASEEILQVVAVDAEAGSSSTYPQSVSSGTARISGARYAKALPAWE